ncbi:hypothetical protein HYT95_01125 [Candidatus Peregrinibacteria bacterium]|nr:hypothetical protein [Candidatus Peregrinibacteria bacterium]
MRAVPHVFAAGLGTSLSQYSDKVCGGGFAPAWMCTISGAGGVTAFLGRITGFVIDIAAGVGVCVFIYACIQIVMSQGQDDKMTAAKKMAMISLVGVFLALSARVIMAALWSGGEASLLKKIFGL